MDPHWTVIAHRGANREAPENTLAAFHAALAQGVRAIELDVRLTSDGHVVVHHDRAWGRTVHGDGLVEETTLEAARRFPADGGAPVPTFEEVLRALPRDVLLDVELKADALNALALPRHVAAVAERCGALDRVLVTSFDAELATDYATRARRPAGLIVPYVPEASDLRDWPLLTTVAVARDACEPDALQVVREGGRRVFAWTVNAPEEARALHDLGVDGIITDTPGAIAKALAAP